MPELPEVETVLRTLEHQIQGRKILDVDVRYPKMIENDVEQFKQQLKNQTFNTFMRRGKYLLFGLDDCILMSIYAWKEDIIFKIQRNLRTVTCM